MSWGLTSLGAVLALLIAMLGVIIWRNRAQQPDLDAIETMGPQNLNSAGAEIHVMTWNLGYAALGKDADFVSDRGKSLRALSRPEIADAAHQIAKVLSDTPTDIYCLQENAEPDFLTRGVDLRGKLNSALERYQSVFWADLKSHFFPRPFRFCHGMTTYACKRSESSEIIRLPAGETLFFGVLKKHYVGLLNRFPIEGTDKFWIIINLHVPVFKTTPAARAAQLARLLDVAQQEHARGHYVILAGDWNMRLSLTEFPHQTDMDHLYWLQDFPFDGVPSDWSIVVDPNTPTVRSMHEAFVKGQTFTSIIDGFIASPNVRTEMIRTQDLQFRYADHNPVEAIFSANLDPQP